MKEKKECNILFRTTLLVRAHELVEELRMLNLELQEQELLKEKIRRKTDELKSLNKKLDHSAE